MTKEENMNVKATSTAMGGRGRLADFGGDADALKEALLNQAVENLKSYAKGGVFFVIDGDTISWRLEIPHDYAMHWPEPEPREEGDTRRRVTIHHGDGRKEVMFMEGKNE